MSKKQLEMIGRSLKLGTTKLSDLPVLGDILIKIAAALQQDDAVPSMPITLDRRPLYDDEPEGYREGNRDWAHNNDEAVDGLAENHEAIPAALATAPQEEQAVEPVAWLFDDGEVTLESDYKYVGAVRSKIGAKPLYTAPPTPDVSGLVEALEDIVSIYESGESFRHVPMYELAITALAAHKGAKP